MINKTKIALLGATALFAATSAHAQIADTWDITGDVSVSALNQSTDAVTLDNSGAGTPGIDAASIAAGYKNSISAAAVGSSASSSFNYFNNSAQDVASTATLEGGVTVVSGNVAAVLNTNDLTGTPTITTGSGNSISLASVGSSASLSAAASIGGGNALLSTVEYSTGGDVLVQSGDGIGGADATDATVGGNDNTIDVALLSGIETATITGGSTNSISVAGVGSSASLNLALNAVDASNFTSADFTIGGSVTVNSTNSENGAVTVSLGGANAVADGANIQDGDANSISVAAVGSSASVSFSDTVNSFGSAAVAGTPGGGNSAATFTAGDIAVNSYNAGSITNNTEFSNSPSIVAGNNNSISAAGVGSSASVSFTAADYSDAGKTAAVTSVGGITVASLNLGAVTVTSGLAGPTITDGYNNSISNAAVGASASQAISVTALAIPAK